VVFVALLPMTYMLQPSMLHSIPANYRAEALEVLRVPLYCFTTLLYYTRSVRPHTLVPVNALPTTVPTLSLSIYICIWIYKYKYIFRIYIHIHIQVL
jgi:hypothetical protein